MPETPIQSTGKEQANLKLHQQAARLKESPFFSSGTDAQPLAGKQAVFLALAGLKPVSEASSGHWIHTPNGRRSEYDDPAAVGALLHSLGLAYRLRHDKYATDVLVSLQPELLDAYETAAAAGDQAKIGELFGYPASAVTAFGHDPQELLPQETLDQLESQTGLGLPFRLSQSTWRDELAVVQHWEAVLQQYDLLEP